MLVQTPKTSRLEMSVPAGVVQDNFGNSNQASGVLKVEIRKRSKHDLTFTESCFAPGLCRSLLLSLIEPPVITCVGLDRLIRFSSSRKPLSYFFVPKLRSIVFSFPLPFRSASDLLN